MHTRRAVNVLMAVALLLVQAGALAQGKAAPTEVSLKEAIAHDVATWNRHDVKAWSALLTDDIWYTEADDFYQRMKGRPAVINYFGDLVKTSDLKWNITRVKMMPNGTATVVLRHFALILPRKGDKYASSFESTPSVSRWRIQGDRLARTIANQPLARRQRAGTGAMCLGTVKVGSELHRFNAASGLTPAASPRLWLADEEKGDPPRPLVARRVARFSTAKPA